MNEVTASVFWAAIGRLNVHPCPIGNYPYTSVFETPSGQERGRIVDTGEYNDDGTLVSFYFLR